jgi:hypothetical protein
MLRRAHALNALRALHEAENELGLMDPKETEQVRGVIRDIINKTREMIR